LVIFCFPFVNFGLILNFIVFFFFFFFFFLGKYIYIVCLAVEVKCTLDCETLLGSINSSVKA
jgi:hypothetical protein